MLGTYRNCSQAAQVVFDIVKYLPTPPQLSLFDLDELTPKQSEDLDCFCTFLLLFSNAPYKMCSYTTLLLALLLINYPILPVGGLCYNPDQIAQSYVPCDTTSGEHSACCASGDQCTVNGYCFGSAGYMYRGGCTDINWQSPNCAPRCRDGTKSVQPYSKNLPPPET